MDKQRIYSNSFRLSIGLDEVIINFELDNQPATEVRMTFPTAKTLTNQLYGMIEDIEIRLERGIPTMDALREKLRPKKEEPPTHGDAITL